MERLIVFNPKLTKSDRLVLANLAADVGNSARARDAGAAGPAAAAAAAAAAAGGAPPHEDKDAATLAALDALNDPSSPDFQPTVFTDTDYDDLDWGATLNKWLLHPYLRLARLVVRAPTDIVMLTLLLLYATTSLPSAAYLLARPSHFSYLHGLLHLAMQGSYLGTYTLMRHQHIHQNGVLSRRFAWLDRLFPYVTDPLMGHTWNSYYYHHVKHHHIEGNGPGDLSSTIRYQRDDPWHFAHYVARFLLLVWLDLPLYFVRKGRPELGFRAAFWEFSTYALFCASHSLRPQATVFVLLLPFVLMRLGLMVGNWGQHAFVDVVEPDSDYRSSITLVDVASNRYSFNDGYHTSHHLNPLRHWREHPNSFIKAKQVYAKNGALVFHNIDYIMLTVQLLRKNYRLLAECLVPIGEEQLALDMEGRIALLKRHTRKFSEEEIREKFKSS